MSPARAGPAYRDRRAQLDHRDRRARPGLRDRRARPGPKDPKADARGAAIGPALGIYFDPNSNRTLLVWKDGLIWPINADGSYSPYRGGGFFYQSSNCTGTPYVFGAAYGIAEPADGLPVQLPIVQSFLPAAPNDSVYLVDATLPPLSGSALNSRLDLTSGHCVSGSQSYPATALKPGGKVPPSEAGPISLR